MIEQQNDGKIKVIGDPQHPVNHGMLCSKGMNLHHTVTDQSDRLLFPQMRFNRSMPQEQVSWNEALERTALVFKHFIKTYGPDSVAFYVSGQCLTEEYYLWNKLMKGFIGSNNIDTNSRLCMSSAVVAYKLSLGEDAVPVCYNDIELSDCMLIEGANPAWCHPILWRRIEAHKAAKPATKIIVVDPRQTQSSQLADLHLQLNPGTDIVLNHAIARVLIEQNLINQDFIDSHTLGFEELKAKVFEKTIETSALETGLSVADIQQAALWIGQAKGFLSMWTMGLNQSVIGVNKNLSLINLSLITGQIGKAGSGPFSLTGQPNAMGGREVGGLANMLASHREIGNAQHRQEMQDFWQGNIISDQVGLTAVEMFKALETGKLKAIWIACTNPVVSLPDTQLVERALKNAKFVVVQDVSNKSETLAFADVILPAAAWAEKTGTMTNAERRISYLNKVVNAPGQALPDAEIITKFAQKMGWEKFFNYDSSAEIYKEYTQTTINTNIDVQHLSHEILQKNTYQWPVNQTDKNKLEGTERLFEDHQFYTPHKKAIIHAVNDENLSEKTDQDFPLVLLTGRLRDQWHTMTKTGKVNKLNQHFTEPLLEINPHDALVRGLKDSQIVNVNGRRGNLRLKLKTNTDIKIGTCFVAMHWGRNKENSLQKSNLLTNTLFDPRSKEPDFKFSAVEVEAYQKPLEKIVIIGAGSAALGFVNQYRKLNILDEIHVFSKEIYPFYNRVMLPDYVNGSQTWEQLVKLRENQFAEAQITVHKGVGINHIDTKNKILTDQNGLEHTYDKLILGTGSRAFMPKNFPKLAGIFNMRSRLDADNLGLFLSNEAKVVVVGGGLLGIEMAAALQAMGMKVSLIQRIDRLMDRQLDGLGSQILHEELSTRGIEIFYNDEVEQCLGQTHLTGIKLKSGRELECRALIVAAGTLPNIELAKEAGLACNRGVLVNDYLKTSDESIFACGEIAEWQQQLWGITAAAEEQASIVAKYLNGDTANGYKGSLSMNILKMKDLNLLSIGLIEIPKFATGYEEVVFIDRSQSYYKKCIIKNDRLVGAILIGDKNEFIEFKDLIANGIELSEKRLALLRSGKNVEPVLGKLICSCNSVGAGNLEKAMAAGCTTVEQLCQQTGAGMGCGSCRPELRMIFEKLKIPQISDLQESLGMGK